MIIFGKDHFFEETKSEFEVCNTSNEGGYTIPGYLKKANFAELAARGFSYFVLRVKILMRIKTIFVLMLDFCLHL